MIQIFYFILAGLLQLFLFLSMGTLLFRILKRQDFTISMGLIAGYFLYFLIFEVIAVPMIFMKASLTALAAVMAVLTGFLSFLGCLCGFPLWKKQTGSAFVSSGEHIRTLLPLVAAVIFQCLYVAFFYNSSADAAYYVGESTTAVYTDTLGLFDPYTGKALTYFSSRYVFSAFPMYNAMVSVWTGIHPIIQSKTIMAVINVIISNLIWYRIASLLFQKQKKQYADLMVIFLFLINVTCNTPFLASTFLFTRIYEGKAMLANTVLPMVLYCTLRYDRDEEDDMWYLLLFLAAGAAICFAGSSYMVLIAAGAGILPLILLRRSWKKLFLYGFSMAPVLCWMAAYLLVKLKVLSLKI